jgi:hypothetical protein
VWDELAEVRLDVEHGRSMEGVEIGDVEVSPVDAEQPASGDAEPIGAVGATCGKDPDGYVGLARG